MASAHPTQRRRLRVPIEHTCDGTDKQRCRCTMARINERKREARHARGLLKVPLVHTCGSTNTWSCECAKARRREKYVPDSMRSYDLRTTYGITVEDWQAMFEAQEGRCGICGRHEDEVLWAEGRRGLVVDHCHDTGRVRGLLCNGCNRGIGYLGDSQAVLQAAVAWLRPVEPGHVAVLAEQPPAAPVDVVQPDRHLGGGVGPGDQVAELAG